MEHPNNLLACRTAARLSQMRVASELNVSQSEYSRMELGRRQIGTYAEKLCEIFGVTKETLLEFHGTPLKTAPPENGYVSTKLPVYGKPIVSAFCKVKFDKEPVEMVDKPSSLASNKDAYGVYVPGDSMRPRIKPGDLLYVEPHQPVRQDDLVVVQFGDDETREIMQYRGHKEGCMCLARTNPHDEITVQDEENVTLERVSGVKFL